MSRSVMVALLAAGCVTAAAGAGSYLAVRQNAASAPGPSAGVQAEPAPTPAAPVHETEGVIEAPTTEAPATPALEPETPAARRTPEMRRRQVPASTRAARPAVTQPSERVAPVEGARPAVPETPATAIPTPEIPPREERTAPVTEYPAEPQPVEPVIEEVVIPASAVIGLEIETTVSSERARVEDRVDARVTRDVFAGGRLVLPAGSRVTGAVMLVERGGKVKERARLGVRFHTVALANGRQVPLRTEPIYRDGESPAAESSRKIGGAAVGGAVLGAILGGGKGAIAGATAGAAGGTAAVMSGGRNPAVLAAGTIVTVKLASPAYIDVER